MGGDDCGNDEKLDFRLKYKVYKLSSVGKHTEQMVDQISRDVEITHAKMIITMIMMKVIIKNFHSQLFCYFFFFSCLLIPQKY